MKHRSERENVVSYTALPHIELIGINECVIDGLQGIVEYTKDKIKISLGKYCVSILGDGLFINSFSTEGATVEGTIISLEFESNA